MDRQQTYMQTLSEVMNLLGMTKKELAEKAGVSRQTLYGWEKGNTSLKPNRTGRRVNSTLMRLLDEQIEETSHVRAVEIAAFRTVPGNHQGLSHARIGGQAG